MAKTALGVVYVILFVISMAGCSSENGIEHGKYYLDGDVDKPYIEIINDDEICFGDVDLAEYTKDTLSNLGISDEDGSITEGLINAIKGINKYRVSRIENNTMIIISLPDSTIGLSLDYNESQKILEFDNQEYSILS